MRVNRSTFVAAIVATGVVASTAIAQAEPAPSTPAVAYRAALVDKSVVTTLENGTFTTGATAASVVVRNSAGHIVQTVPLTYSIDGQHLPLQQQISDNGRKLTITPDASGLNRSALRPVASPLENQLAMNDLINALSISTSIGTLVGTAVGAVAGIGIGLVLSAASCVVLSLGCVVAVLPIMSLAAGVGGIAGLIIAGGPTGIAAGFDYVSTLNAPPGGSKYAPQTQGKPGGAPVPGAPQGKPAAPAPGTSR
ncbi:hypothetical protein [Nocardia macrotermitis]|uniref:DUF8020 domain-containing protein n=1 Tax=Nocardia macrotermitis TaxID=2585198 RepID=A0A7K0D6M2_9NOCA|nr:hypothetical protein [Nocardia macrotermitis]MQY20972.1 hypothetical protein [Nocardia macrotermitis]